MANTKGWTMSNELEILKKHLGEVEGKSSFEAKQLCSQISDANDFIGALQVLDLSLKKIEHNLKERGSDEVANRALDASTLQLISNCAFMGESLFDSTFRVNVGGREFGFEIQNPMLLLENNGFEGVLAYTQDKREEISTLLLDLATAITLGASFSAPQASASFNYKDLFR